MLTPLRILRRVVFGAALAGALVASFAWVMTLQLPNAGATELGTLALFAIAFAAVALWVLLDTGRIALAGNVVVGLIALGEFVRIAQVVYGPIMADAALPTFMPVFAFMPLVYIVGLLVARPRVAAGVGVLFWLTTCVIAIPAVFGEIISVSGARSGATQLTFYLLVANPIMLVGLYLYVRLRGPAALSG